MGLCLRGWFSFVGSVILACVLGVVACWVLRVRDWLLVLDGISWILVSGVLDCCRLL